jgi:Domain of unknown function (DUF4440)
MSRIRLDKDDGLTRALAERLERFWNAYLAVDEAAHSDALADDYRAVYPDGSVRTGKPTAKEMVAEPIQDYWLRELPAWPVGAEGAIATYTAEVEVRSDLSAQRLHLAVGEVWLKHGGVWRCRYRHATPMK